MEVVVIILILLLLSASSKKKKKARQANVKPSFARQLADAAQQMEKAAKEVSAAANTAARQSPAKPASPQVKAAVLPVAGVAAAVKQGESLLDDPDCVGGSMPHDHAEGGSLLADEDCSGGSMEHEHAEGIDRADQARRLAAMDAEREQRRAAFSRANHGFAVSAGDLRRAVVMAEILDRPKALRARRL